MLKTIFRWGAIGLFSAAIASTPMQALAQTTNNPAIEKKQTTEKKEPSAKKKQGAGPFHGKLASVDKVAKTVTVGQRTFQVTSATKISKGGKPATLDDGVVGDEIGGYFKTGEDGKLNATSLRFGPKPAAGTEEKKKEPSKSAS